MSVFGAAYFINPGEGVSCEKRVHSVKEAADYLKEKGLDPLTVPIKTDNGFLGRLYPISDATRAEIASAS